MSARELTNAIERCELSEDTLGAFSLDRFEVQELALERIHCARMSREQDLSEERREHFFIG